MSYDLTVYVPEPLTPAALVEAVDKVAGLEVETTTSGGALTVVRGARRGYCCTVDGPDRVAPEDVPPEVTAVAIGIQHVYQVLVEGSARADVPHAVRLARRLAEAAGGAVLDQQDGSVWSRSGSRQLRRPPREERIGVVELSWYCLRERLAADPPALLLDVARRHVPEAAPRRFGEYEPLQGRLDEAGPDGFGQAWRTATSLLFTAGTWPCLGGMLYAGPSDRRPSLYWTASLSFAATALEVVAWRDAVRRLFMDVADGLGAFFAQGELTRGHLWSGRALAGDAETERGVSPLEFGRTWMGLPPRPVWWAWLGDAYVAEVSPPAGLTHRRSGSGVLVEVGEAPAGRQDLDQELDARWSPADTRATLLPNPDRRQPVPLAPATRIPGPLGGTS